MSEASIVSIACSILTLIGVIITVIVSADKQNAALHEEFKTAEAVTRTKIEELTREVREHNNFARRVPVIEEQIKVVNHRIADLEHRKEN